MVEEGGVVAGLVRLPQPLQAMIANTVGARMRFSRNFNISVLTLCHGRDKTLGDSALRNSQEPRRLA